VIIYPGRNASAEKSDLKTLCSTGVKKIQIKVYLLSRFAHVYARCGCVRPLGNGKVNSDAFSVDLQSGALFLSHFGIAATFKVHEGKSS